MGKSALLVSIKYFVLLFFCSVILTGCGSDALIIEVWLNNQSQDNIKVNNDRHVAPGEQISLDFLMKADEKFPLNQEKAEFKIFRSNTHLATVKYEGELWPDPSKGESSYKDEIIIEEPGERNTFTVSSLLGVISVSITHVD